MNARSVSPLLSLFLLISTQAAFADTNQTLKCRRADGATASLVISRSSADLETTEVGGRLLGLNFTASDVKPTAAQTIYTCSVCMTEISMSVETKIFAGQSAQIIVSGRGDRNGGFVQDVYTCADAE